MPDQQLWSWRATARRPPTQRRQEGHPKAESAGDTDRAYGSVLTFRDPDGLQLEMFHREDHP